MGHTTVPDSNNSLYGFKGEIKEDLEEKDFPRWLVEEKRRGRKGILSESTFDARKEKAKERAKKYDESVMEFSVDRSYLPDKIDDKLSITRKDGQNYTGYHNASPKDYRLIVTVGPRGGIKDVQMGRDFHH